MNGFDNACNYDNSLDSSSDEELDNKLCAVIPLEGDVLNYVRIVFDEKIRRRALIDTGSCANAIPKALLNNFEKLNVKFEIKKPCFEQVKLAPGQPVDIEYAVEVEFCLGKNKCLDELLVLPKMNCYSG